MPVACGRPKTTEQKIPTAINTQRITTITITILIVIRIMKYTIIVIIRIIVIYVVVNQW